ncbi:hypothetical protein NS228_13360 [Methylobacterium indicum]|uniref:GCG_CRPN prefix-to-repeats domain-containing protein n=1 Tax=Methylobacterium indicum TaxID=1775910 RepID=UPI000733D1F4|nr:hypothetical protein [Methylobacterium indicum]KTS39306.1 hypothetical protein NS229_00870 [Methylobacterium indicum]KTS39954.1 hypothetical protein NS228_13360 [Methylobacterium indicum]KTS51362.1 hypothetical protein NS230_13900 [Methylobacterium indicum]
MMHVKVLGMAGLVAGGLVLASAAQAAPIGLGAADSLAPETAVTTVAGGCGPGFVPNRFGYCRPFYGPRPVYGPRPYYYGPRPYWRRPYDGPRRFYYGY